MIHSLLETNTTLASESDLEHYGQEWERVVSAVGDERFNKAEREELAG